MNRNKPFSKIMAWILSFAIIFTAAPITAGAEQAPPLGASGEIVAFAALPGEIVNRTVPLGTSMAALTLPGTLTATVQLSAQDVATPTDAEEGDEAPDADEPMEMSIPVPVTWESEPEYDGDTAGTYVFTAIVEVYVVSAEFPIITVTVEEADGEAQPPAETPQTGGLITEFDELAEDIRFQRGTEPILPETVSGTVNGQSAEIPVTWQAEGYDAGNYTGSGLFAFIATPGEGYTLGEGVSAPTIAYFKTPLIEPRMAGNGTSGDPLQITSAAQLFEVATLTNAGMLERMILGSSSATATVHLKLMNDIDLSAYGTSYNSGKGWAPIGISDGYSYDYPFKGTFDGNNNKITGLFINRPSEAFIGLFGAVDGGTVKSLGIVNANITGLTGVGGVVGEVSTNGTVQNCYVTGSITGTMTVGGVAGNVIEGSTVENCYSTAAVSASSQTAGGVVGLLNGSTVENCAALNPSVSAGTSGYAGRVVGSGSTGLSGNVAFSGMKITVGGSPKSSVGDADTHIDGLSKSAADIRADGTIGGLFTNPNGWTTENGKLPGFDAAVEMPAHLLDSANPFAGGTGADADNAYQIATAAQLAKLAELVNDTGTNATYADKYYKLTADIDLSAYSSGAGWTPIGKNSYSLYFKGNFDGNGKTITGLYINSTASYSGLFGNIVDGTVENLGLVGVYINGDQEVGGVAGYVYNNGAVQNCYVTGTLSGSTNVGGVVGIALDNSTVTNCYSTATVSGTANFVGGVVGRNVNTTTVSNCAALNPSVSGVGYVGRVVGYKGGDAPLANNVAFSGMKITEDGSPKSPIGNALDNKDGADIAASAIITDIGGRFTSGANSWTVPTAAQTSYLPGLGALVEKPAHLLDSASPFGGGNGTSAETAYEISTPAQLAKLAELVNAGDATYAAAGKFYKLTADIDLSAYGASYNTGAGWEPIGYDDDSPYPFKGNFDGGGYTVTGLYIDRSADYIGLFGFVDGGTVENLGLVGVNINGNIFVGGVAGRVLNSTVQNCYVTGTVRGASGVGGVVGWCSSSNVKNCYSTATVSGTQYVGGVAGYVNSSTVQNCAALNPSVTGSSSVGRVVGFVVTSGSDGTRSGNYAWSAMPGTWAAKAENDLDGADMSSSEALTADFWTDTANWDTTNGGTVWTNPPWTFTAGYLPSLSTTAKVDSDLYLTTKTLEFADVTVTGTYTYDGSPQTPTVTVKFDGKTLAAGTDYTLAVTAGGTNAGTATVTVTGKGNYSGAATQTFTIGKKTPVAGDLTFDLTTKTYTGAANGITTPTTASGKTGLGTVTVKYNGNTIAPTYAETYAVTVDIDGSGTNFSAATDISLGTFTISKAYQTTPSIGSNVTKQYGAALTISATGGESTGAYSYSSSDETVATISSSGVVTILKVGSTSLSVKKLGDVNYNESATASITLTVTKADGPSAPSVPVSSAKSDTTVTLTAISDAKYAKNTSNSAPAIPGTSEWQDSNVFTGLSANTTYYFFAYYPETAMHNASAASTGLEVKTDFTKAATPAQPTTGSVTAEGFMITNTYETSTYGNLEYQIKTSGDYGAWKAYNETYGITDLAPNTLYTVQVRYAGNSTTYSAGDPSPETTVTTSKAVLSGSVTIDGTEKFGQTLTVDLTGLSSTPIVANKGVPTFQWKRGSTNISTDASYTLVAADIGQIITVIVSADNCTGSVDASTTGTIDKADGPSAPSAPTMASRTDTTITLTAITGAEYRLSTGSWQDSVTFSGLTANTAYTFNARIKATTTTNESAESVVSASITTLKTSQNAPSAPTQASKTAASVTLNTITGAEYGINTTNSAPGAWQDAVLFDSLTPNTTYYFFARMKETTTHEPSAASGSLPVTTDKAALSGSVTIDGMAKYGEQLTAVTTSLSSTPSAALGTLSYQWKRGATNIGTDAASYTLVQADIEQTITVTVTAANCIGSVDATAAVGPVSKADGPAAPTSVTGSYTGNGTTFTYTVNIIAGAEYSKDGTNWLDSNVFTGFTTASPATTFYARIKETATHNTGSAGNTGAVTFTKLANSSVPTLGYTVSGTSPNKTITITTVTGAEYQFGTDGWSVVNAKTYAADDTETIYIRYAATDTNNESAAASATVNLANAEQPAPLSFTLIFTLNGDGATFTATIPTVTDGEYSFDGVTFSSANTKTDCQPNTSYTGYVRLAAKAGFNASPVTSDTKTTPMLTVATPVISPASTIFTGSQSVTITCATTGAAIYYTTDGSAPDAFSTPYTAPFSITATTTVRAVSIKTGMNNSTIASATYTLNTVYTLTVMNGTGSGSYAAGTPVSITANTAPTGQIFDKWTGGSGGTFANVNSATTTFTMPAGPVTVTATYKNDGSGSSSGGGGSSYTPPATTVTTEKQPNMPALAKVSVTGTVKDNVLTTTITEKMARDAIAAVKDTGDGIAIRFNVTGIGDSTSLTATFQRAALEALKAAGVKDVMIGGAVIDLTLDTKAIAGILAQTTGNVTVSATRQTNLSDAARSYIGSRPVFDITIKDSEGVTVSDLKGGSATIGIAYKAASTEKTGSLYGVYVDENGKPQLLTNSSYDNGRLIFKRGTLSIYGVGYNTTAPAFTDTVNHWAKDNIDFVASRELISGTSATTFAPDTAITHGMFLMALGKLSGADVSGYKTSSFTDVPTTSAAMPYIEWAIENKIVEGISNNQFAPDRLITREDMAVIMVNYAKATGYTLPMSRQAVIFADDAEISAYAKDAVKAIQQTGVISEKSNNLFDPKGSTTRAEAATILRRFVELVIDEGTAHGWVQNDAGQWQYINTNGKAATGWLSTDANKYWFDDKGIMVSGKWVQISGKWYYFYSDGALAVNTTIDGYKVGEDGVSK